VNNSNITLESGNVTVGAEGTVKANAVVESPKISISGVKVAVSIADATLSAVQKAYISGGSIMTTGMVKVYSWQNKLENGLDLTALDGSDAQKLKALAMQLGLPAGADKNAILDELRESLWLSPTASIADIKTAYQNYFAGAVASLGNNTGGINVGLIGGSANVANATAMPPMKLM
jgi:hypothetical protein